MFYSNIWFGVIKWALCVGLHAPIPRYFVDIAAKVFYLTDIEDSIENAPIFSCVFNGSPGSDW